MILTKLLTDHRGMTLILRKALRESKYGLFVLYTLSVPEPFFFDWFILCNSLVLYVLKFFNFCSICATEIIKKCNKNADVKYLVTLVCICNKTTFSEQLSLYA